MAYYLILSQVRRLVVISLRDVRLMELVRCLSSDGVARKKKACVYMLWSRPLVWMRKSFGPESWVWVSFFAALFSLGPIDFALSLASLSFRLRQVRPAAIQAAYSQPRRTLRNVMPCALESTHVPHATLPTPLVRESAWRNS